jgi:hypothetical protein
VLVTKYYSGDRIKKKYTSGTCDMYGGEERRILGFDGGQLRERGHLEDLDVEGRIVLTSIVKNIMGDVV